MSRVAAIIFHPRAPVDAGPLTRALADARRANAERQAAGFQRVGAEPTIVEGEPDGRAFGGRLADAIRSTVAGGVIVLGSGAFPLATAADRRAFVAVAAASERRALSNNRFSADVVAVARAADLLRVAGLERIAADNGLPRWLAERADYDVADLATRWRLQVDLDSPLDAMLAAPPGEPGLPGDVVAAALDRVRAVAADPGCELLVAGRTSAAGLAFLETATASRTRLLVEERGFRTRIAGQRPTRSVVGLVLDRGGPAAFGPALAELADAALVDSRVLLAHRFGADEANWPIAEDRFASDLLLADRIADPWLRALTESARAAPIPIVLGGHSLVGPGLRLVFGAGR